MKRINEVDCWRREKRKNISTYVSSVAHMSTANSRTLGSSTVIFVMYKKLVVYIYVRKYQILENGKTVIIHPRNIIPYNIKYIISLKLSSLTVTFFSSIYNIMIQRDILKFLFTTFITLVLAHDL